MNITTVYNWFNLIKNEVFLNTRAFWKANDIIVKFYQFESSQLNQKNQNKTDYIKTQLEN